MDYEQHLLKNYSNMTYEELMYFRKKVIVTDSDLIRERIANLVEVKTRLKQYSDSKLLDRKDKLEIKRNMEGLNETIRFLQSQIEDGFLF